MKKTLFLIICILPFWTLSAQYAGEDCRAVLKKAQHDFEIGKIERAKQHIPVCLESTLTENLRKEILELLIEMSIFSDDMASAEEYYLLLKKVDPFYQLNRLVPEMRYLANAFITYPTTTYSMDVGGLFYSRPLNLEGTIPDVTLKEVDFSRERGDPMTWYIGGSAEFNLNNSDWDASIGYLYIQQGYRYTADLENVLLENDTRGSAKLSFRERQQRSQVNLGILYQFNKKNRFYKKVSPFVQLRVGINILHPSSAQIHEPSIVFPSLNTSETDARLPVNEIRNTVNLSMQGIIGIRYRVVDRVFLQAGFSYLQMLGNYAKADESSIAFRDLRDRFSFQDDDFSLQHFGLFLGGGYYFFKTRRKR